MKNLIILLMVLLIVPGSALPQDHVMKRLNESPRHHEWVVVKNGERSVHAFVVYPEVAGKAPAVLVIHENRGLNDWVRSVADRLAEQGYIAIAPDLLSGAGPNGGKTSDFPDRNAARDAIYELQPEQVTGDLNACFDYVAKLPASTGKVAVGGFCWGGSQTFRFATNQSKLEAAFVFYGSKPREKDSLKKINCPVYGFYGGNDNRVNATLPDTEAFMKEAGKRYEPVTYKGGRHGFMRAGEAPDANDDNKKAHRDGWKRWLSLLQSTFGD